MTTKAKRKTAHEVINMLSHEDVAAIVRENFPRIKGKQLDQRAKQIIAEAHRLVSPRKKPAEK